MHSVIRRWTCLAVCFQLVSIGCGRARFECAAGEAILFSKVGSAFFQDSICLVCPDGSHFRPLLSRESKRSFLLATGNSLQTRLVVTVHLVTPAHRVENHLYWYRPSTRDLQPLPNLSGEQGRAAIAPDDRHVAFEFVSGHKGRLRLGVADLTTGETTLVPDEEDSIDRYPSWRPDGMEILFVRLRFSRSPLPVQTSLIRAPFPPSNGEIVFGPQEAIGSATYAPNGKQFAIWSRNGIEIIDWDTLKRRVIFPISALQGRKPGSPGLIWARRSSRLAFTLFNPQTSESELWTVQADGGNARPIFAARDGTLWVGSFVLQ